MVFKAEEAGREAGREEGAKYNDAQRSTSDEQGSENTTTVSQPASWAAVRVWPVVTHTHTHTHTRTHKQATVGGIRVGKACVRACDVLLCVCVCFCFLFLILPRVRSGTKHSLPSRQDPTTTNNVQRSKKNK